MGELKCKNCYKTVARDNKTQACPHCGVSAGKFQNSETAFLVRNPNKSNAFDLRWFAPAKEVDLCGHATLASAHILWEQKMVGREEEIEFRIKKGGPLKVNRAEIKGKHMIQLTFPKSTIEPVGEAIEKRVIAGLRLDEGDVKYVGITDQPDYFVEVKSAQILRDMEPNFPALRQIKTNPRFPKKETRGFVVTAAGQDGKEYDYYCRCFFPGLDLNEDPVTGSAHCALTPHWEKKLEKTSELLEDYQMSQRGGVVISTTQGDNVVLYGEAVTVDKVAIKLPLEKGSWFIARIEKGSWVMKGSTNGGVPHCSYGGGYGRR